MFSEMGNVFRVREVFFSRIYPSSILSVPQYGFQERGTHFRRETSRNGVSRTHTRHRHDVLVQSTVTR